MSIDIASSVFWSIFCGINLYILISDFRYKRIPNIALLLLISLAIIGYLTGIIYFFSGGVLIWIGLSVIAGFSLFYFNIWSAGDAKYVITLSFFIPAGTLIYTLGNIGILTLIYLSAHAIYIYIIKSFLNTAHSRELGRRIFEDISSKLYIYFVDTNNTINIRGIIRKTIPLLIGFLIFFTCIRLLRLYIVNAYIASLSSSESSGRWRFIIDLVQEYNMYIVVILIIILYLLYRFLRSGIKKGFFSMLEKLGISQELGKVLLLGIFSSLLTIFIIFEYFHDAQMIQESLIRIFTFYIFLWLGIKTLRYIYYVTFQLGEIVYKPIKKLSPGDIIDIPFLIKIFGTQKALGYKQKTGKYYPDPKKYFEEIENPISQKTTFEIKNIYKIVNSYHKKQKTLGFEKIEAIKVLKTFAFAPYIFLGFLISIVYQDAIIQNIAQFLLEKLLGNN